MSKHSSHKEKNHEKSAGSEKADARAAEGPDAGVETAGEDAAVQDGIAGQDGLAGQESPDNAGPADKAAAPDTGQGPADGTAKAGGACEGPGPEDQIADLEAQLAEARDQLLRKAADYENFRKRMNREKLDAIDFANQSLLLDLIPILDDFDRAMQSAESSKDFTALYEGVGMIAKRLASTLDSKWGLRSYVSAGAAFDPNFHEALMMEKSSAVAEQTVQMDLLKGYTLKNRVIRSAKVKVLDPDPSAPAIAAPKAPQGAEDSEDPAEATAQS
jgi:molecular chaperone GrpE